jgi:hypothetical protein
MRPVGFEPIILAGEQQPDALDRADTGTKIVSYLLLYMVSR